MAGQLYQKLLVGDAAAVDHMLDEELEKTPLARLSDELLLPVLAEMKRDLLSGAIDQVQARRCTRILESVLVDAMPKNQVDSPVRLVCVAGQTDVDGCAARLLAMACWSQNVNAEALSPQMLVNEAVHYVCQLDSPQVVILQVAPASIPHARRLTKALLRKLNESTVITNMVVGEGGSGELGDDFDHARVHSEHLFAPVVAPLAEMAQVEPAVPA